MNSGCKLARIYFDIATQPASQFCVVVSPDTTTQWLYQGRIKYIAIHQKRQMDQLSIKSDRWIKVKWPPFYLSYVGQQHYRHTNIM